jgi:hypothetical protein
MAPTGERFAQRRGEGAGDQAAGMGERGDGDVPAGGMAQRLGRPRRLARHLERQPDEEGEADRSTNAPGGRDQMHRHHRDPGVEHAGEAGVVRQVGPGQQGEVGQRPGDEPGEDAAPRHAGDEAKRSNQRDTGQIRRQVEGAEVNDRRAPGAPGLARGEGGLPVERGRRQAEAREGAEAEQRRGRDPHPPGVAG